MDARLITSAIIVFLAAIVQSTPLSAAYGITPNLVLVALVTCACVIPHFFDYVFLVIIAALGLRQGIMAGGAAIGFTATMAAVYGIRRALPFQPLAGYMALIIFTTGALYGLIDWHFIARTPLLFAREIAYNAIIGACAYAFMRAYERKSGYQF